MHIPVLLNEVVDGLKLQKGRVIVDGTVNGGGHAREIITRIMSEGMFIGIEWDRAVCARTKEALHKEFSQYASVIVCEWGNYKNIKTIIEKYGVSKIDGMLIDLGFSSLDLEESRRGFSFQKDEILDMRYDNTSGAPAWQMLAQADEKTIADKLFEYGEERYSRSIARAIVRARTTESVSHTNRLAEIVRAAVPRSYRYGKIHPATKTFQALRIWVNSELDNIRALCDSLPDVLAHGARVAIISFHSLEDRIVKQWFVKAKKEYNCHIITKKPIVATNEEQKRNPRSRSAKLRILEWATGDQYKTKKQKYFK